MISRRRFLKTSLSALAFAAIPKISFSQSNPDVVVIGGGSSGLSVTAELMKKGKSVVCLDAMGRKGGRCFTNTSIFGVPYDLGAHWLHNFNYNKIRKYGQKHKEIFEKRRKTLVYVPAPRGQLGRERAPPTHGEHPTSLTRPTGRETQMPFPPHLRCA